MPPVAVDDRIWVANTASYSRPDGRRGGVHHVKANDAITLCGWRYATAKHLVLPAGVGPPVGNLRALRARITRLLQEISKACMHEKWIGHGTPPTTTRPPHGGRRQPERPLYGGRR